MTEYPVPVKLTGLEQKVERAAAINQISNWIVRLEELYAHLDQWYAALPQHGNKQIFAGSILQRNEPLMEQFEILPQMLPTRAFLYGKNRISFTPSALWIIGANGRVNITTSTQRYILLDKGNATSDWQIVTSQMRHHYRKFDQALFDSLITDRAIEAA